MRLLLFKTALLTYLLFILVGCPGKQQRVQASFSSKNLTMTCTHKALDELDDIVKVWIFYDQTPIYHSKIHVSKSTVDGVGFEGEGFTGQVVFQPTVNSERSFADIYIYTKDLYWGFRDKPKFVAQVEGVKKRIMEALIERCN